MDGINGLKETTSVTAPGASSTLSGNIFTVPGKADATRVYNSGGGLADDLTQTAVPGSRFTPTIESPRLLVTRNRVYKTEEIKGGNL